MAQVASKLDYLGRGVDCRESKETWLEKLDDYGADKIRDLDPNDGNIIQNPVQKNKTELRNETTESKKGVEGSVKVTPHRSINLGGELKVKRDSSKTTKCRIDSRSTRIVTMRQDTSQDPHIVKRDGTNHYTKYHKELSQFILDHIDAMQTEASSNGREEATCLGKMVKDLKEGDSVAKLEEYLQHARSEKELCQQIWQTLANACCAFIKEKPYTHYVKSITLGAIQQESYESTDSNRDTSAGVHGTGFDVVDGSLEGGHQVDSKSNITRNESRGTIDSDSGTVTAEEVIEASMEPVSSLINKKSQELKIIMKRLLKCYSYADQGVLLGPFHVYCIKPIRQGLRERKIYWQVIGDEIYGTTTASEASTFYVQCNEQQFCCIIHKTSELQTQYFATVQRPFLTECPLKLVPNPKHQDICFTLMNKTKQPINIPQTEDEWKKGSPFSIKLPKIGIGFFKPERYINVRRIIEEWKKKTGADSKAKHTPASGATLDFTPHAATSEETKETREKQNRKSTAEKLEYSTGSSASLDKPGQHVITTQFYFTPVVNIQGSGATISGGPPPPPSRIESDSASGGNEVIRQQQEDNDARLKQDFIELVGSEYVFPLPVRAVDTPDTQQ